MAKVGAIVCKAITQPLRGATQCGCRLFE